MCMQGANQIYGGVKWSFVNTSLLDALWRQIALVIGWDRDHAGQGAHQVSNGAVPAAWRSVIEVDTETVCAAAGQCPAWRPVRVAIIRIGVHVMVVVGSRGVGTAQGGVPAMFSLQNDGKVIFISKS